MKRHFALFLAAVGMSVALVGSANAGIQLPNWTINLGGTTGTNTSVFEGIDEAGFTSGISHVTVIKGVNPITLVPNTALFTEVGDIQRVEGVLRADTLLDNDGTYTGGGGPLFTPLMNAPTGTAGAFEITFRFAADALFTGISAGGTLEYIHTGGAGTFLEMYIDEYGAGSGGSKANFLTGLGYTDGNLVASFVDSFTGIINPFNVTASDGSDDATFLFVSGLAGVLFGLDGLDDGLALGPDLTTGVPPILTDIDTDSNFDIVSPPSPTMWNAAGGPFPASVVASPPTQLNFFASEDGSATLSQFVPEASSMVVWFGLSAACGAMCYLRRRKSC